MAPNAFRFAACSMSDAEPEGARAASPDGSSETAAARTVDAQTGPIPADPGVEEWEADERSYIFEERLAKAEEHKVVGNEHFRRGEWEGAIKRYQRAIYHADFDAAQMFDLMDHHREKAHATQIPCKLNYVLCIIKMREAGLPLTAYGAVIEDSHEEPTMRGALDICEHYLGQVLKSQPENPKAFFRRGQLCMCRGDLSGAREALIEARRLQGNDGGGVKAALLQLRESEQLARRREREMYGGLLQERSIHKEVEAAEAQRAERVERLWRLHGIVTLPLRWPCAKLLELCTMLWRLACALGRACVGL